MSEAESCGVGESIREIWQIDKKRLKDEFDEDQKKNCKIYIFKQTLDCVYYIYKM